MTPATPLEAQRLARAAIGLDRVRLESALRSIAHSDGFPEAMKIVHAAVRLIAAELREEGADMGGFSV